jgi:hypothetical protein
LPKQFSSHLPCEPKNLDTDAAVAVTRVLQDKEAARIAGLARQFCRIVDDCCGGRLVKLENIGAFDGSPDDACKRG